MLEVPVRWLPCLDVISAACMHDIGCPAGAMAVAGMHGNESHRSWRSVQVEAAPVVESSSRLSRLLRRGDSQSSSQADLTRSSPPTDPSPTPSGDNNGIAAGAPAGNDEQGSWWQQKREAYKVRALTYVLVTSMLCTGTIGCPCGLSLTLRNAGQSLQLELVAQGEGQPVRCRHVCQIQGMVACLACRACFSCLSCLYTQLACFFSLKPNCPA